jgi:hypothetical protein
MKAKRNIDDELDPQYDTQNDEPYFTRRSDGKIFSLEEAGCYFEALDLANSDKQFANLRRQKRTDPSSGAFLYMSRTGDIFLLQVSGGKNGSYSFTRKLKRKPVPQIPDGYEVYEHPETGHVTIRKCRPSDIHPEEKTMLEEIIRKERGGRLTIVDVEDRSLVVYMSSATVDDIRLDLLRGLALIGIDIAEQMRADMIEFARYHKRMRFTLTDPEKRLFSLERWQFKDHDDWCYIEGDMPLATLAKKYVRHLW